ncbi:hypothetical protein GCM10027277_34460 [Pseudoduganella ginsengisoli]|uniref:Transporter substrate-binding domain-containing protein n=1 Tax=Pseudoduganella ginsengisoli TaxID=1462440 RepID=A0A6L6Q731_9BURK|nr:transporter substrate-binding domain-containing protein [Pseudoduganella ginsengisoli]MTW05577.1 transporter substrate-binding domain-containing protein [Pseudoduganella ginsengisoli]
MRLISALILSITCAAVQAEPLRVPKFSEREPWAGYIMELLETALAKAPGNEPDQWQMVDTRMTQDRAFAQLRRGQELDVFWSMTSAAREQGVLTVRIPLLKGVLGTRLLIIRKDSVDKLAAVKTLGDLKNNVTIGQGHDWPDTAIIKAAGFNVMTSASYDTLYQMLKVKRFDGIALGANEIDDELAKHPDPDFVIEKNIALSYPAPVFFFVSPQKKGLAERIEKGLLKMMDDGSFNALFDKRWSKQLLSTNLKHRQVFHLPNPLLSPQTAEMIRAHPEYFLFAPAPAR